MRLLDTQPWMSSRLDVATKSDETNHETKFG
jgi:hypothetical protein